MKFTNNIADGRPHVEVAGALRRKLRFAWPAFLFVALASVAPVAAQTAEQAAGINREYAIKAAFLYHFSTYVQWPSEQFPPEGEPFVIGLVQNDPFGTALAKIAKTKTVAGHPIEVRVLKGAVGISQCQILFVPKNIDARKQTGVLLAARGSYVLTVGETDDFIERGGIVQFYLEGNKVRFAFSEEMTKREYFKVSSKLLSLAKIIPAK